MNPQDLKIRFSNEISESWLFYWINEIHNFDWSKRPIGKSKVYLLRFFKKEDDNNKLLCHCYLYRTKTQRVVFISATEEFPKY